MAKTRNYTGITGRPRLPAGSGSDAWRDPCAAVRKVKNRKESQGKGAGRIAGPESKKTGTPHCQRASVFSLLRMTAPGGRGKRSVAGVGLVERQAQLLAAADEILERRFGRSGNAMPQILLKAVERRLDQCR